MLYGVSPLDPVTFVGGPILVVAIAMLACYIPARRARHLDPIAAIRQET
jgi:ABC-type antimicrobial peptide transport system permease subunit